MKHPNSKPGEDRTTVSARQSTMLWQRLRDKGYLSVKDFCRKTGMERKDGASLMAFETVRRAFSAGERQVALLSLAVIMMHLEFTREEVKQELQSQGDLIVSHIIGTGMQELSIWQEGLISAVGKLGAEHHEEVARALYLIGLGAGVDIADDVVKLGYRHGETTRKRGPAEETHSPG
jgi:hypothetical protein